MVANQKPPRGIYSPYQVIPVLPEKSIKFVSMVSEWEAVTTHWYGNHSVRCSGNDDCHLCIQGISQVWKAYLLGSQHGTGTPSIFQLTPLAAYELEEATTCQTGLLGAIICLKRAGKRKNSPLTASIRGWVKEVTELPYDLTERCINVLYRKYEALDRGEQSAV